MNNQPENNEPRLLYITSDQRVFMHAKTAWQHAATLDDSSVTTLTPEEAERKASMTDIDDDDALDDMLDELIHTL